MAIQENEYREKKRKSSNTKQPLSIYNFIHQPQTIPHASMYHLNLRPWSYTPSPNVFPKQLRHNIRRRNTSSYILISSLSPYIIRPPLLVPFVPLEPSSPLSPNEWLPSCIIPAYFPSYLRRCNPSYLQLSEPSQYPPPNLEVLRAPFPIVRVVVGISHGTHRGLEVHRYL